MGPALQQYLYTNPVPDDHEIIEIHDHCIDVNLRCTELPQLLRSELFISPQPSLTVLQQAYASRKEICVATLVNTFDGLEAEYVHYLEESMGKPIWGVANPLRKPQHGIDNELECIRWLDTRKQNSILLHPSTAFFMMYCGWNSTLESMSARVPMVVWPMAFDQFINAKLVTEQLGIGLQICEGLDAIPSIDIVENIVKAAMTTEIGEDLHLRALKIKESINEASCKLCGIGGFIYTSSTSNPSSLDFCMIADYGFNY
ncbi:hypothetical protein SUGI_0073330 [Cryptomeria japonica]|nr:hypothetical protein SUGI_0073330 [Cryptomeria japonica]